MRVYLTKEFYDGEYDDDIYLHFVEPKREGSQLRRHWTSGKGIRIARIENGCYAYADLPSEIKKMLTGVSTAKRKAFVDGNEYIEFDLSLFGEEVKTPSRTTKAPTQVKETHNTISGDDLILFPISTSLPSLNDLSGGGFKSLI